MRKKVILDRENPDAGLKETPAVDTDHRRLPII
jgi:hypothetical protein